VTRFSPSPEARPSTRAKVAALVGVALMLLAARQLGILQRFAEPSLLVKTLVELGPWGYLTFVAAYAVLQPFGVPGTIFVMAAPLIWSWPIAFALSMTGTMAASVVGFSFARFVARDWIAKRIPARFQKYEDALERRGFATVFLLRLLLWMPPMLHAFFGVSKVRFRTHFWGSFLGYLPTLFLISYFGEQVWAAVRKAPPAVWVGLGVAAVAVAVAAWLRSRAVPKVT
jgi:uncharacterized membrane protein YdjX (TVP38/TMEM64 family)